VGEGVPETWEQETDVHLAAGLRCSDCHRHGLDHQIARGYEGEAAARSEPAKATLTCRGCHLGAEEEAELPDARGGRLGAPYPRHEGLPREHLEKLACTTCHSGPWPGKAPRRVQTSRAHGLGLEVHHVRDENPPYIAEPVFIHQYDGKIGPHRMVWPSFWGRLKGEEVEPIDPDTVVKAARSVYRRRRSSVASTLTPLTADQVTKTLEGLAKKSEEGDGTPVYVTGGRLFQLDSEGKLADSEHAAASPYSWPLAHDVRPASQSLGDGDCADCHAMDSGFFYGRVVAGSPTELEPRATTAMIELQELDPAVMEVLARTLIFRPAVFWVGFVVAGALAAALAYYGLRGIAALTLRNGKRQGV
jgi:hypothetical protein